MVVKVVRLVKAALAVVLPVPPDVTGKAVARGEARPNVPDAKLKSPDTAISSAAPVLAVVLPKSLLVAICNVCSAFQLEGCTSVASAPSVFPELNACFNDIAITIT